MKNLPEDVVREIMGYVIYDVNKIGFDTFYTEHTSTNYNGKYKVGYVNNNQYGYQIIKNKAGQFLSRIEKENGRDRYYITTEVIQTVPFEIDTDEGPYVYYDISHVKYSSKYIGKDLKTALMYFT